MTTQEKPEMSTHPRPTPLMTTIMGLATMVAALAVT